MDISDFSYFIVIKLLKISDLSKFLKDYLMLKILNNDKFTTAQNRHFLVSFKIPILNTLPFRALLFALCSFIMCGIAARDPVRTFSGGLRRSTVAHFARKVRGANIMAVKHELKIQQSHSPEALTMFATCSWPSLCEQSELQCWRRNKRLCGPVQISAARALPLTFDISILNTPSYVSLLFVKTIITPVVPNKKSSIRGRE